MGGDPEKLALTRFGTSPCRYPRIPLLRHLSIPTRNLRDFFDGLLRRGQADALDRLRGVRGEALQRERQMRAALGLRHGVDFVDDDGAHGREHLAPRHAREQ